MTSTDYVDTLLNDARERAAAEARDITFQFADAERRLVRRGGLTCGVMFTPSQKQAACELLRICRSVSKIGLANWIPTSFIGALFKMLGGHVAPPPDGPVAGALGQPWLDRGHVRRVSRRISGSI